MAMVPLLSDAVLDCAGLAGKPRPRPTEIDYIA